MGTKINKNFSFVQKSEKKFHRKRLPKKVQEKKKKTLTSCIIVSFFRFIWFFCYYYFSLCSLFSHFCLTFLHLAAVYFLFFSAERSQMWSPQSTNSIFLLHISNTKIYLIKKNPAKENKRRRNQKKRKKKSVRNAYQKTKKEKNEKENFIVKLRLIDFFVFAFETFQSTRLAEIFHLEIFDESSLYNQLKSNSNNV